MPDQPTEPAAVAPKRIIICCDGTWQSAVSGKKNSPSNVTRLARCLERATYDNKDPNKVWQQVVWYDSGIGTTSSMIGKVLEGAVGNGLEGNIVEAYNFLVLNYNSGDQIMVFGFSRGAYTARTIAGLVSDLGICEPRNMHHFPEIWEMYKKGKAGERFYGSDAYWDWVDGKLAAKQPDYDPTAYKAGRTLKWDIPAHGEWASDQNSRNIEVCAVYDTVGAIGLPHIRGREIWPFGPDKTGFHNVRLNRNIKRAFHALALDEHRESFTPTLWWVPVGADGKPLPGPTEAEIEKQKAIIEQTEAEWYRIHLDNDTPDKQKTDAKLAYNKARRELLRMEEDQKKPSELLQVWFPGVHISVGGGSSDTLKDKGDLEEISNVTFSWMLDQICEHVGINQTIINQEASERSDHIVRLDQEVEKYKQLLAKNEEDAQKSWKSYLTQKASKMASAAISPIYTPKVPDVNRRDRGWATGAFIESYTKMYMANGSKKRTPGQYDKDNNIPVKGFTNEQIHPTVGYRMLQTKDLKKEDQYHPLDEKEGDNSVQRRVSANGGFEYVVNGVVLPEYKMKPAKDLPGNFSYERLASGEGAYENSEKTREYIKKLDEGNGFPPSDYWA